MEGRYAKDCKVAVYSLNDTVTQQQGPQDPANAWWTDTGQAYDNTWWHGDQAKTQQTHQLMLPPPKASAHQQQGTQQPATQGQAVSGLLIAMAADTSRFVGTAEENIIDLMIDSGAATHVCPLWFAPKFQLHEIRTGQEPQLRTVTNTQIKVHGYKYVIMKNNRKQPTGIPFYICDGCILSVTRLAEQGFNIQPNETPTMTHRRGSEAQLIQQEGLYFVRAEMIHLPSGTTLTVKDTEAG